MRVGGGFDSNVLHDPQASAQSGMLRVDLDTELEPTPYLQIGLVGWFDQHLPYYLLNETNLELLFLFRRPIARRLAIKVGSLSAYHRELTTFVEGTIYTRGSTLLGELAQHASLGLDILLGAVEIEIGGQGHIKDVSGTVAFDIYGVDANVALRWVPNRFVSLRLRYQFLYEDIDGIELHALDGKALAPKAVVHLYTQQGDLTLRTRPIASLDLYTRYEISYGTDDQTHYLDGLEHRLVGGLRFEPEQRWVVDVIGKLIERDYWFRHPNEFNQNTDLTIEIIADVELWLHRNWGLFARYQFDAENATPAGTIYVRHSGFAGVAARTRIQW
jgi:hypothetical protein